MSQKLTSILRSMSLWIFLALLTYMPLHIFLSTWLGTTFGVLELSKIAKDIVLIVGFVAVVTVSMPRDWFRSFIRDRLVWLIVAYCLLNLILAFIKPTDGDAELLGLVYNTRFFVFFLYGWLLSYHYLELKRLAVKLVLAVGVVVVVFGILQYSFLPDNALRSVGYSRENGVLPAFFIDDKPDLERVMSTVRDPNSLGSYLIIIGSLALAVTAFARKQQLRLKAVTYTILTLLCLWFTFSRSAWVGFVFSMSILGLVYGAKYKDLILTKQKLLLGSLLISLLVAGVGLYAAKDSYFVQNVIFHADQSTTLEDPNELRLRFWRESVDSIAAQPEGGGPGTAGLASIRNDEQGVKLNENYYLQIAAEVGVAGIILFLAILGMVAKRLYVRRTSLLAVGLLASFAGLALTNFLVHIWSNEAVAYTWWGLAGLVAGVGTTGLRQMKRSWYNIQDARE